MSVEYVVECCICGCNFILPNELHSAASRSTKICFYCPYGHEQHFKETVKLTKEQPAQPDNVVKLRIVKNDN